MNLDFNTKFNPMAIIAIREQYNMTQQQFSNFIGISIGTLRNWEQGRREPDGAATTLLKLLSKKQISLSKPIEYTPILSKEQKESLIKKLNWDYSIKTEDILKLITQEPQNAKQWFARSFQYLKWQEVVKLWGIDTCLKMNDGTVRKMIVPQLRSKFDYVYSVLSGNPIPVPEQSSESSRALYRKLLSDRRYSS